MRKRVQGDFYANMLILHALIYRPKSWETFSSSWRGRCRGSPSAHCRSTRATLVPLPGAEPWQEGRPDEEDAEEQKGVSGGAGPCRSVDAPLGEWQRLTPIRPDWHGKAEKAQEEGFPKQGAEELV